MHMPSSKTTLIQIIGRALRLHDDKNFANIILPFSSKSDETNINTFLKTMARNDSRIRKSYINKKVGGYIDIVRCDDNIENKENDNDIELKYDLIFDKMGILKNSEEIWEKKLEEVKKYIDDKNKKPSKRNKNLYIKKLGYWIITQNTNYTNKQQIMSNDNIRSKWENFIENLKYKKYFISREQKWKNNFEKLKKYINEHNKLPSKNNSKNIKKLAYWITSQNNNYKNNKYNMSSEFIKRQWKEFIEDKQYSKYFISNEQIWRDKFEELKKYIDNNNKKPSKEHIDKNIKKIAH